MDLYNADKQINDFERDLESLITRYAHEYDMNYVSIIGVLNMAIYNLMAEAKEPDGQN